jgi:HAD superfamily hydrolase (TIGR01548 family)
MLIHESTVRFLPKVDALVFDIDGVLVDVSGSFPVVVCETVQHYFSNTLGWGASESFLRPDEVDLFKRAGGFNADEDLTTAVILFFLAKSARTRTQEVGTLRESPHTLGEFADGVRRAGGGLLAAESVLLEELSPSERREVTGKLNARLVLQLFREIYGGVEWCERLYGFAPEHVQGTGYVEKEMALVDAERLEGTSVALGVISGRSMEETQLALERLGLQEHIRHAHRITATDGLRKPDPRTLRELRDRMQFHRAIFVGDTLDDLQTVNAYRELPGSRQSPVHSCQVLSSTGGSENQRLLLENRAEIIAPDVNAFLTWFHQSRKGK